MLIPLAGWLQNIVARAVGNRRGFVPCSRHRVLQVPRFDKRNDKHAVLSDHRCRQRERSRPETRLPRFLRRRNHRCPEAERPARFPRSDHHRVRDRFPIQVLRRVAHCRRPMPSIFRFLAHPPHFPGPEFPGEPKSACRFLGRATPKRSGVLSHCRSRAKSRASCQPVASRRQAAALQALAGALSLDGAPLVPARSRGLPDPIARRLVPHRHFCPSEDSRPILRDPEQGLPRARWSQRRPIQMAPRVFAPTRQECGEPLAMARANASVDARYLAAVRKFSETLCLFLPRGPRRAELVLLISEQPQARERGGLHAARATPPTNPTRPAAAGARAPSSQALLGGGVRRGGGSRRTGTSPASPHRAEGPFRSQAGPEL